MKNEVPLCGTSSTLCGHSLVLLYYTFSFLSILTLFIFSCIISLVNLHITCEYFLCISLIFLSYCTILLSVNLFADGCFRHKILKEVVPVTQKSRIFLHIFPVLFSLLLFCCCFQNQSVCASEYRSDEHADASDLSWFLTDIRAREAWSLLSERNLSSEPVIVAVIDTGVDYTHPLIAGNLLENTEEKNGAAGVDDDGNGYPDDIYGIDTCSHTGDPMDDSVGSIAGHGTHIAGTILQTAGVSAAENPFNIRILCIKAGDAYGNFPDEALIEALNYAVARGADVINLSVSLTSCSRDLYDALLSASEQAIFVSSAGNRGMGTSENSGSEGRSYYPAALPFVVGVMSYGKEHTLSSFSNWDRISDSGEDYELAAPGESIFSSVPGGSFKNSSGTSMSAGIVSGAAALLCANYKKQSLYTAAELTSFLMNSGISDLVYTDSSQGEHLFSRLDLPSLLTSSPKPHLICRTASLHYMNGSNGQYRFSFLIQNQGADALKVSLDAACSIPGVQITFDHECPDSIPSLSSFEYSGVLTLTENPSDLKTVQLSLAVRCSGKETASEQVSFEAETSIHTEGTVSRDIPLQNISLSISDPLVLKTGDLLRISVAYIPENTTADRSIAFSSSAPEIISVDADGTLHARSGGTAVISAVSSVGFVRKVRVTVLSAAKSKTQQTGPASETPTTLDSDKTKNPSADQKKLTVGQTIRHKKLKYRITSLRASGGTLCLYGLTVKKKTLKTVSIPDTIRIGKRRFRVTRIAPKTFQNCRNLRKIRLGKYIRSIGRHAFRHISKKAVIRSSGYRQSRLLQKRP